MRGVRIYCFELRFLNLQDLLDIFSDLGQYNILADVLNVSSLIRMSDLLEQAHIFWV